MLRVYRTFDVGACSLSFTVVERPAIGSVRIFDRAGEARSSFMSLPIIPRRKNGSPATGIRTPCWKR